MGGIPNIPGFIDSLAEEIPSAEREGERERGGGKREQKHSLRREQ